MNNFNDIVAQFYTASASYSSGIQPYAIKLFLALLLLDILITWIQFNAEGQLDAAYFMGRLIKQILGGGFVYLMIVNAFSWMNAVVQSFIHRRLGYGSASTQPTDSTSARRQHGWYAF